MQSVLEIATPVCHTPADVMRRARRSCAPTCAASRATNGLRVGSAGTHPFSLFERQRITAKDRYRQLVDQLQYIARRELIFGMHIHVAIDDPEKAIKVMNGLLPQLAPLLALSASSPFWRGEPTGLMSSRQMVFSSFPRSGPAAALSRLRGLRRGRRAARAHRLHRRLHAHLVGHPAAPAARHDRDPDLRRRHPGRGRRRDHRVLPGARQAALRALRRRRGDPHLPPHPDDREQVARRPLRARGAGDGSRHRAAQPDPDRPARAANACARSSRTHASSAPSASSRASAELLARGNSADRQLRIFNANRDIREVVEEIAIATELLPVEAAECSGPGDRIPAARVWDAPGEDAGRAAATSSPATASSCSASTCSTGRRG